MATFRTRVESSFESTAVRIISESTFNSLPLGDFGVQARLYCVNLLRNVSREPIFFHQPLTALPYYDVQQRVPKGSKNW